MSRRDDLERQRELLVGAMEAAEPRELAGLSKELRAVNAELDAVKTPEDSVLDDLARRREARLADPAVFDPPSVGGVVGGR